MLSRVADSLYWMARYLERAEHTARVLSVHLNLMLDHSSGSEEERWRRIVETLDLPAVPAGAVLETQRMIQTLTLDRETPASIISAIISARNNARQLREHISSEMWGQLNRLYLRLREPETASLLAADPQDLLRQIIDGVSLFHGVTLSTISHGECWQFIETGRYLERAGAVTELVGTHFRHFHRKKEEAIPPEDFMEWVGLLKACGAFEAYCNRYTADFQPKLIAEFLLLDADFPKAVCYAAQTVDRSLQRITDLSEGVPNPALHRISGKFASLLHYGQIDEILDGNLPAYLESVGSQCEQLHQAIYHTFVNFPVARAIAA